MRIKVVVIMILKIWVGGINLSVANEAGNIAYDWNILEAQTERGLRRRQIQAL